MSASAPHFDDRESFRVAEAVLSVVRERRAEFPDDEAVWEAFIEWQGRDEGEYLRRIRAGGQYVFYSVLISLYTFAESLCGEQVCIAVGRQLADTLLDRHMPDLLHTAHARHRGGRATRELSPGPPRPADPQDGL